MSLNLPSAKDLNISITITDSDTVRSLNKKYRDKDYTTDVLSFNVDDDSQEIYYLGDIIINRELAQEQAQEQGHSLQEEISQLAAHGILHLLGMHHEGDDA